MPATRPTEELRRHAAKLILERLRGLSVSQAARDLGLSRQAIYDIKRAKYCPSLAVVQRACEVWGIEFDFRGLNVSGGTFKGKAKLASRIIQPSLFDLWDQLQDKRMVVVAARRFGPNVELTLRLTLSA